MSKDTESSLKKIIHQVTAEKLQKLQAQKDTLNTHFGPVLKNTGHVSNPLQNLKDLQKALKDSPIKDSENTDLDHQLKDLDILIQLAEKEASSGTCDQTIQHWIRKLTDEIKFILQRCDYSYLYGSIMMEYLDDKKDKEGDIPVLDEQPITDPGDTKDVTIQELTDRIFVPSDLDKQKFRDFLSNNVFKFDDYEDQQFMETQKKATLKLAESLPETSIDIEDLKHCINDIYSQVFIS